MRVISFLSALLLSFSVLASSEVLRFDNATQEQQFRELTMQLRCPKCQNNSIADSNSMIASDMRQKVYELMQQGQTKEQVVDYMVDRYGYFVTYEPPITPFTVLLWLLPALFLVVGSWVIIRRARRIRSAKEPMSEQDKKRLQTLLEREGKSE
ncbi:MULTISPECIES: cytochrome c-type biogenesis protein [Pectobacterium]|jgi:cytochrome c-type biogenesis protein CcmH|uniref:Cytochrome c-type biogenesis protein n=1 Tax=Pectobacterium versatile TaxID=2488639 RepID=A0A221TAS5_9GAMM|nr:MULTISPECIES: cytochrome c-type biogenesis protein [Pectobacterium]ASN86057.1 Cytochrome c-type biogenesis protein CcmH [Pectobacterium versatile]MBA0158642.1 cytochrome c-type biogenesis protein CcmH [Pectobacterium versatile]MBA0164564.1 cytochrome c-type biogenesis protein CcmH [Pectobacterium versatile]MBN3060583.1 cytochrome c-type biogenesis protein CcmH [Pectobacterium versatile]MBN3238546.1 cytochrome c-type biogenesis protein CcmH [Pectobacterium versatile]